MNKISKDELEQLSKEGLQKIRNYFKKPEDIQELSDFMANFNHYSLKNQALIQKQYAGAFAVGSFNFFKEHGLRIKKGEKAIKIYAPREYQVVRLENGKGLTPKYWTDEIKQGVKEGKYQVEKHQTFVPVPVFDILQTNAKPEDLPNLYPNRPFNFDFSQVENKEQLLHSLFQLANKHDIGVQYSSSENMGASKGKSITYLEDNAQVILLNKRLSKEEQIPTLIHELTHAFIHQKYKDKEYEMYEKEFQAEFCSYLTCKSFGIDTSAEAMPYIAEWTKNLESIDDQSLIQQLSLIKETSAYITDEVMESSKGQLVPKTVEQLNETLKHEAPKEQSQKNDDITYEQSVDLEKYAKETIQHPKQSLNQQEMMQALTELATQLDMNIEYSETLTAGKGLAIHYGLNRLKEENKLESIEDQKETYNQTLFISKEDELKSTIDALSKGIVERESYQLNKKYQPEEKEIQVELQKYLIAYQLGMKTDTSNLKEAMESLSNEEIHHQLSTAKNTYQKNQVSDQEIENDKEQSTLNHVQVTTTFKGHDFIYDIQINPEDKSVSGTYQRDQEEKRPATESACLSALRYVIDNHSLNNEEIQYLQDVIQQGELHTKPVSKEKDSSKETENKTTWQEKLDYARSANIIEVAQSAGLQLKREGNNQYRDVDNHSMVFTPSKNSYYENNGQFGGDPIHFVQNVVGIKDFKDAVNYLNNQSYGQVDLEKIQQKEPYQYDASKESKDFSKARQYLVQERGIDGQLVDKLHEIGLIRQDKRNNVLFMWDNNGKAVGCTEQGTVKMKQPINGRDHWKGIQRNSEANQGFNFGTGEAKNLKFFEAPIDALSYASIHGLEPNTRYVSMDGLKENTVLQFVQKAMEKTEDHIESIQLCVDNDEAGSQFIQKFNQIKQLDSEGNDVTIKIVGNQPNKPQDAEKWDWNNELIRQKSSKKQEKRQESELER